MWELFQTNNLCTYYYFCLHESHRKNLEDLEYQEWVNEQIGMREILKNFANISKEDILGMRAPHLKPGRNAQYEVYTMIHDILKRMKRRS